MHLKLRTSMFFNTFLELHDTWFAFSNEGERRFGYEDVDCILLSLANQLSFQVGKEVFQLRVDTANPRHQEVMAAFAQQVSRATGVPLPPRTTWAGGRGGW